jgi:hypothetical protein
LKAAGALWDQNLQRFTMHWEVIASAEGLLGILKVGGAPEILGFSRREGPIFLTRLVISSARTARA